MKQRNGLILLGLLLLPCAAKAQSGPTLSGTVSEKGTGRPLEGAKVVVVGGKANSESTDSKGGFVLRFPAEVRVGDLIRIHIELDGYLPYTDTLAVAPAQPHSISLERIKNNSKTVAKPDVAGQPAPTIVFRDQIPEVFTIELYRGSRAIISRKDLTEKGWGPFQMANERPFSIYLDNGNLYAEARIYNGPDLPAVEVNKGNFVVRPMDWDRNFSDNALEIVNERMQPVLQIIYKRNGLIQILGIFRGRNGGMIFEAPELPEALPRIFKYPSWKYLGQYAEAADQDVSPFARATDSEFIEFVRKWLEEPKRLLQSSNRNPAIMQAVAQNLMTWFYEKGVLYRGELVRRLKDKGDKETARLKTPPDSQAILSLPHADQIESMSKILADIENLAVRLEIRKAEDFANQPPSTDATGSSAGNTKEFQRTVDQVDAVAQHHEPEDKVVADVKRAPPQSVSAATGSIAIGGNNLGTAIVNNNYSDRQPRPGVVPSVKFCVSPSKPVNDGFQTKIRVCTDTPITDPFWAFFFDGPVIDGESVVEKGNVAQPHTLNHGHPIDPSTPSRDMILRLQVSVGVAFSGIKQNWEPSEEITFTVSSAKEVHLTQVFSGYGTEPLNERMVFDCGMK